VRLRSYSTSFSPLEWDFSVSPHSARLNDFVP